MAYNVEYRFDFQSVSGSDYRIDVLKDGYSGSVKKRALGGSPMLRRDRNECVCGTSLDFIAECVVDGEYEEFASSNPFAFKVKVYSDSSHNNSYSTLVWQGYISPEVYSAPDIAPPYDVQITATDGLGELKLNNYEAQGIKSLSAQLSYLLGFTGLSLGYRLTSNIATSTIIDKELLDEVYVNLDWMAGQTCYDVLQLLLSTLHATITLDADRWLIFKETHVLIIPPRGTYVNYEDGYAKERTIYSFGSANSGTWFWPVGKMTRTFVPAKKKVVITADNHYRNRLDGAWTLDVNATDDGDYWTFPGGGDGIHQEITFVQEVQKSLLLSVKLRNIGDSTDSGNLAILIHMTGSAYAAGSDFYLITRVGAGREDKDDTTWVAHSYTFNREVQAPFADDTDDDTDTVEIHIPLYYNSNRNYYGAETLEIYIFNGDTVFEKRVYEVTLYQEKQIKGFQKIVNIDNGARGEAPGVEVAFVGTTGFNDYAGIEDLLCGVPMTSAGVKITSWTNDGGATYLDFLSMIARDYALSYAAPRIRLSGTLQTYDGFSGPNMMFKDYHDNEIYIVDTFSWDMFNDELSLEMISLPADSITVDSESTDPVND